MTAVFERILEMSLTAAVVIVVVMLIRLLLRKAPRKYSYALWSVAAFRLVCPVSFQAVFSLFGFTKRLEEVQVAVVSPAPSASQGYFDSVASAPVYTENVGNYFDPDYMVTYPLSTPSPVDPEPVFDLLERAMEIAAVVWLVGLTALLIYGIVSYMRLCRKMSTAILLEGDVWQSDRVQSPFILGFIRPKIFLPFGLSADQQRYVLAHERYHLKRLDHIVRPLSFLILAVHWFNPFVWLAYYLMSRDMEMSCDEKVLSTEENIRKAYSTTLLSFAANRRFPSPSPLAFGESGVKGRIRNALNWKKPRTWVTILALVVCIVVIVVCAANPREVSVATEKLLEWCATETTETVDMAWIYQNGTTEERSLSAKDREEIVSFLNELTVENLEELENGGDWFYGTVEVRVDTSWGGLVFHDGQLFTYWINMEHGTVNGIYYWEIRNEKFKECMAGIAEEEPPVQEPEIELLTETLGIWYADLTHDGVDEVITLRRDGSGIPATYSVTASTSDGTELWRGGVSDWRGGQNGFYLYERDGKQYLMQWQPAAEQGWYNFSYRIFSLNGTEEPDILAENTLQYDFGVYQHQDRILAVDVAELRAFEAEVNALLQDAVPLLVMHNEETILGDPSDPVTSLWTSPADDWERQQQTILNQQADREDRTLAVWPLNDLTLTVLEGGPDYPEYIIDVYDANNYFYWGTSFGKIAHELLYFRYEENGVHYLMELKGSGGQGVVMWDYRIFSVGPESLDVIRENSLYYEATSAAAVLAVDVEAIRAFEAEVNALLEHTELIAGFDGTGLSYNTPGNGPFVYSFTTGEVERIEELQEYWREEEHKFKVAVAVELNRYYVENLMQPGGRGHGQFAMLDSHMDERGAVAYVTAFYLELDEDGNWMAEYANIPMMFTFEKTEDGYELTEAWVEEKEANFDAHDDLLERFPAAAAQAVIDGVYVDQLRQNAHQFKREQPAYGVTVSTEVEHSGSVYASDAVSGYAASYIVGAHPDAQTAQIDGLKEIPTGAVGTTAGHLLYRLEYSVQQNGVWQAQEPVYLVLHADGSSSSVYWYACGILTEGEISEVYGTPEMLEQYNYDPYLAAVVETVNQWRNSR